MQAGKIAYFLDIFMQYPIIAVYKGQKVFWQGCFRWGSALLDAFLKSESS